MEESGTKKLEENETKHQLEPMQMDDALSLTKFGKFNYILILISGVVLTTSLIETLAISFVIPVACEFQMTTQNKGILSAIALIGIITSSHMWGFLADTKGRRKIIVPTLLASFLCTVLSSLVTNFSLFVTLRFFTGFFVSGSSATIYAYLGEFHNSKNSSRAIMAASSIFGLGCMLLPGIALLINLKFSYTIPLIGTVFTPWRLHVLVCGIPSLIAGLCLLKFPESPKFTLSQGKQTETIEILKTIYAINTGKDKSTLEITSIVTESSTVKLIDPNQAKSIVTLLKSMWAQTSPIFMPPYLKNTVIACIIQFGIFATANGMYMWFPEILNRVAAFVTENPATRTTMCDIVMSNKDSLIGNATEEIKCLTSLDIATFKIEFILEFLYAVGFAVMGLIINAVGKLPILVFILCGCGAFGAATVFITMPMLSVYFYAVSVGVGLAVTVVNASTTDLYPTNLRAMAVCITLMCGRLGSVFGANMVAVLLDTYCSVTFLASGIALILCGVLSFFIPNIRKNYGAKKIYIDTGHDNTICTHL